MGDGGYATVPPSRGGAKTIMVKKIKKGPKKHFSGHRPDPKGWGGPAGANHPRTPPPGGGGPEVEGLCVVLEGGVFWGSLFPKYTPGTDSGLARKQVNDVGDT